MRKAEFLEPEVREEVHGHIQRLIDMGVPASYIVFMHENLHAANSSKH